MLEGISEDKKKYDPKSVRKEYWRSFSASPHFPTGKLRRSPQVQNLNHNFPKNFKEDYF
jgi:hypothetical protein